MLSSLYVCILSMFFCLCIDAQSELQNNSSSTTLVNVGVILDLDSLVGRIGMTSLSLALSDYYSIDRNFSAKIVLHVRDSNGQIIDAAASALSLLKDVQVDAIIGPQKSAQSTFVIGLGNRTNVPIISFSATSPSIYPQTPYFVQPTITDDAQVGAIAAIVKYFRWTQVILIHEESDYGNDIYPYLMNALQDVNARVSYISIIPVAATDDFMLQELYKMKTMQISVFLVHISSSLASKLFLKVKEAGMMREGYAWIVTSGVMDLLYSLDSHVIEAMEGVLGVKPMIPNSRKLSSTAKRWKKKFIHDNHGFSQAEFGLYGIWAYNAMWALAMAAERVQFKEQISSLQNTSSNLFDVEISKTGPSLRQALSEVTFQGLDGEFRLVNGKLESSYFQILNVIGKGEREVGIWTPYDGILSERDVNNTSSSSKMLKNILFPGDSIIVPFKKLRVGVPLAAGFIEFVKVGKDPQTNASKASGFYIDMFDAVMAALPYVVPYEYVPFETFNGSSRSYDEMLSQVYLQEYDAAVGDFTVTTKRLNYVDFTLPFAPGGITMIVKIEDKNIWFFLEPFQTSLWLTTMALFIFTGVVVWILEHRLNNAYRGPPAQHAGMIFYFPFMSVVYAQSEGNNSEQFGSACCSCVDVCCADIELNIHSKPFSKTNIRKSSTRDLSKGSKKGGISGFYTVKPNANLFLSKFPNKYRTIGKTISTEGFGFAFQKGSPLVADVSRAVIKLTENHRLSEIEERWMNNKLNNGPDSFKKATLTNFAALFGITGGITTICLLFFMASFLCKNRDFVQRIISNSSETSWSKARAICKHFDQRDPDSFLSSKYQEEDGSPNITGNPRSNTVVPVSTMDSNDENGDISPKSEHAICKHFDQRDPDSFRSSKYQEEDGSPNITGNPRSSTVVPVSNMDSNDENGDISPKSEHALVPNHQIRSTDRLDIITNV
ncbi:hypothetical protein RD792_008332 [Penstemon davidsonii]|uniref:Glutamate receptor n=1 Tax=Penstemon davidsonii TaxID=160366 RepID=A0ABR0D8U0_9LAMI|nr:hypothetical protein RD792_008332 [Penstemon davidsonii]